MGGSTSQLASSATEPSLFSTSPTTSTTTTHSLPSGSTSTSPMSSSEILRQQISTQDTVLRIKDDVVRILSQPLEKPKELYIDGIGFDDELIWLLIGSKSGKLYLRNCRFGPYRFIGLNPYYSAGFDHILEFLNHETPSKPSFNFAVQFNNDITQWILCDEFPNLESEIHGPITSLLFILSSEVSQDTFLENISSLVVIPSKSNPSGELSSQSWQNLKSVLNHPSLRLKRLLLKNMNFIDNVGDFISISQPKSDLIYLWRCFFYSSDPGWSILCNSMMLVNFKRGRKTRGFQFLVRVNGATTRIVNNQTPSFFMPDSSDLTHGLILSLEEDLSDDISLDNMSFMALFSSGRHSSESFSTQSGQNINSFMNRQYPNLKYLLLDTIMFDNNIGNFILQQKLAFIHVRNCLHTTAIPVWSTLHSFTGYIMNREPVDSFELTIRTSGHTTQAIYDQSGTSLEQPAAYSNIVYGLIITLPDDLSDNLLLNDTSLLVIISSKTNPGMPLSPQSRRSLESIVSRPYPNLKYLLFTGINVDGNIENLIPISRLKLDLLYFWNGSFIKNKSTRSILCDTMEIVTYVLKDLDKDCRLTVRTNGHATQVVYTQNPVIWYPNASNPLDDGMIIILPDNLPNSLCLDSISFLAFFSPETDPNLPLSPQAMQDLKSIMGRQYSNLTCLLFKGINIDGNIEDFIPLLRLNLNLIYFWNCGFRTDNPVWSTLYDSMTLINSVSEEFYDHFLIAIRTNGNTNMVVCNQGHFPWVPDGSEYPHGLIITLPDDPPTDIDVEGIPFLAVIPPEENLNMKLSLKSKQSLTSIMSHESLKGGDLLIRGVDFDGNIEDFISISQLNQRYLIYLWNCGFTTDNPIWSALCDSMERAGSLYVEKARCFQFDIPMKRHTIRIVCNQEPILLLPNSPDLIHGLILFLGQNFPRDLPSDEISFLVFLPATVLPVSDQSSSSKHKQTQASLASHFFPKLKYLFLRNVTVDDVEAEFGSIRQLGPEIFGSIRQLGPEIHVL
jgi:hypothetical protein